METWNGRDPEGMERWLGAPALGRHTQLSPHTGLAPPPTPTHPCLGDSPPASAPLPPDTGADRGFGRKGAVRQQGHSCDSCHPTASAHAWWHRPRSPPGWPWCDAVPWPAGQGQSTQQILRKVTPCPGACVPGGQCVCVPGGAAGSPAPSPARSSGCRWRAASAFSHGHPASCRPTSVPLSSPPAGLLTHRLV